MGDMSNMVRVKICGLTTLNDAEISVKYGADALGFVFAESKRQMKPKQVWNIIRNLPIFTVKVGVFVNEDPDRILDIATYCNLDAVQLHGEEPVNHCKKIAAHLKVIKAVKVKKRPVYSDFEPYAKYQILLESNCESGGSGLTWDWDKLPKRMKNGSMIVSGGLNVRNVRKAISSVNPIAVDVASGVEVKPGVKDHKLIKQFISRAKGINL